MAKGTTTPQRVKDALASIYDKAYYDKTAQIVIDFIEELEELANRSPTCDEKLKRYEVGAMAYQISNVQEIINPELRHEIGLLREMAEVCAQWEKDVEAYNIRNGFSIEA